MYRCLFGLVALHIAAASAWSQIKLERKYEPGQRFETSINAKIVQKLMIGTADIDAAFEEHQLLESRVGERGADGRLKIVERFTAWQADLQAADQQVRFDLVNPEIHGSSNLDHFFDPMRMLAKTPRTLVLDKAGKLVALEGYDRLADELSETSRQQNVTLLSAAYYRDHLAAELDRVPASQIREQDAWERTSDYYFYGNQSLELTRRYRYVGTVEQDGRKLERIELQTTKAAFRLGESTGDLPIIARKTPLTVAASSGQILFDRERGRVARYDEQTRVAGDITLLIGLQQTEVPSKVELTLESDATLLP